MVRIASETAQNPRASQTVREEYWTKTTVRQVQTKSGN